LNVYDISRNIYKNTAGNKIIFEEVNHDLKLTFSYAWLTSEIYGFIKQSNIKSDNSDKVTVEILDGIQNILPYGVYEDFQNELSTLSDGYKKNELIPDYLIGIYSLSSIPSDKAEPSESLRTTTVWSKGLSADKILLSSRQLNSFRCGESIEHETDIRAARGAYFINSSFEMTHGDESEWIIVSEINQDSADVENLKIIVSDDLLQQKISDDVKKCTEALIKIVASSDGLQLSNEMITTSRHFSNVLFNVMRGGIPDNGYFVDKSDFITFLNATNRTVLERNKAYLDSLKEKYKLSELIDEIEKTGDKELRKLSLEYLPITFSRRHGDPSRPWNKFSIDIKDEWDNKILNYQGNWRDLFQNWEALALSYPSYILSMITKFLNASTADGYNPYRVTRNGYDWEIPEPDKPWANIGYWGDHQIIYLQKLLEITSSHAPDLLNKYLYEEVFAYANVPYRIKSYNELLEDPQETVDFDHQLDDKIVANETEFGSDARFLYLNNSSIYQVNLAEKLLVPLLSKLSNFIPEGGIWMNTQRPEWNDANNALVGYGVSMVTLYYLRRYVSFLLKFFAKIENDSISLSVEVNEFMNNISDVLIKNLSVLDSKITDKDRRAILDGLGNAGSDFRNKIYAEGFSGKKSELKINKITELLSTSLKYINQSIKVNEREDGLYHSYNLMTVVGDDELKLSHLYEMLEGQVAVLSSGYLNTPQVIKVLDALRKSKLYREDQNSYVLYPDRQLPLFNKKNTISSDDINKSALINLLVENGNHEIIVKDNNGNLHFNGDIKNSKILHEKLNSINIPGKDTLEDSETELLLDIYETMFNHKAFTGRSGTFYKYEGLGSIYWHMVSKLLLAVYENYYRAVERDGSPDDLNKLKDLYYKIKDGIGADKNPADYGAFPTDPYSHTPCFTGVQQPGMTGQVKEDIISRFGELGVIIQSGQISFNPSLLKTSEFLESKTKFKYYNVNSELKEIELHNNSIAFTYCQVPVIYKKGQDAQIVITKYDNETINISGDTIDKEYSTELFNRSGLIQSIEVTFNP
jgi:hypothetical protein